jgi:hypothetical protein
VHDLVPDALNRDELRFVMRESHIVVGLYDQDAYGGTASREAIELGATPLWIDTNEYALLAGRAGFSYLARPDFSDIAHVAARIASGISDGDAELHAASARLRSVVRRTCSYESTTQDVLTDLVGQQVR